MKHFIFKLLMPNNNSWNGEWNGSGNKYVISKSFYNGDPKLENFNTGSYYYDFGDGWTAQVKVEEVSAKIKRKAKKKSDGFCGYNWMVNSIINHGTIKKN